MLSNATIGAPAPDEEVLGKSRGYPIGTRSNWFYDESVRVGSFTHVDAIWPCNYMRHSPNSSSLNRTPLNPSFRYKFEGNLYSIDDYLSHQRTSGLLFIRDGSILAERYQYDRNASDRFVSNSMAKSVVSIGISLAMAHGIIRSLDDKVLAYVPALRRHEIGRTRLRDLLRMASGIHFRETYDGSGDFARFVSLMNSRGSLPTIKAFNVRDFPAGQHFNYASIDTQTLAVVLQNVTGQTLSQYLEKYLWSEIESEFDATWVRAPDGLERASGNLSATLVDWGRLGIVLANNGMFRGREVIPTAYLIEATDWHRHPNSFAPGIATSHFGYGYHFWTFPGQHRRFALLGVYGQAIFIDPGQKLVLVHTGVAKRPQTTNTTMGQELRALWEGLVAYEKK